MSEHDQRDDYDDEPHDRPLAPEWLVRWPSAAMWVFGLAQCIFTQFFLAFLAAMAFLDAADNANAGKSENLFENEGFWVTAIGWPVVTAANVLIMIGANRLRQHRHFGLVIAATILTFLSLPCFYFGILGIPIAIWVFILLARRDVRARFEANAFAEQIQRDIDMSELEDDEDRGDVA